MAHIEQPTHVYKGKFKDRFSTDKTAGILTYVRGDNVPQCLTHPLPGPLPRDVERYREYSSPLLSQVRLHPGIVDDPEMKQAKQTVHGVFPPKDEGTVGELVNPPMKTLYQQSFIDRLESVYKERKKTPLGRVPPTKGRLPEYLDPNTFTFGVKMLRDGNAGDLVNPPRPYKEVYEEDRRDHDIYLMPYKRLDPGEQSFRKYENWDSDSVFGIPTYVDPHGRLTKKCFQWSTHRLAHKTTPLVQSKLDAFREKTQHQLGKPLEPMKADRHVGDDHVHGISSKGDPIRVKHLLTGQVPHHLILGNDRYKGIVGACRYQLRNMNFYNIHCLREIFDQCDPERTGYVSTSDVRTAFKTMGIPLENDLLEQLICYFDPNSEQRIKWKDFVDCFDWKKGDARYTAMRPGTSRRVLQNMHRAVNDYSTTSGLYNGGGALNPGRMVSYGAPSIKSGDCIPKYRRVSDKGVNYGDEVPVGTLMNPSILSKYGVTEYDMLKGRTKEEIRSLFCKIGVDLTNDVFEQAWRLAQQQSCKDEVSVDSFRAVIDGLEAHNIHVHIAKENTFF